jgi:CDP-diacylglycerol--serine O-phosphatidyltransferase
MVAVKRNWLSALYRPLSRSLFGATKTWRGFHFLPIVNALAVAILSYSSPVGESLLLGSVLGLVYMLFELPNSFLKRRLGIASGGMAVRNRYLFLLLDKTDSAFGVSLAYYFLAGISLLQAGLLFTISSAAHILFSLLLVSLNVKKSF